MFQEFGELGQWVSDNVMCYMYMYVHAALFNV